MPKLVFRCGTIWDGAWERDGAVFSAVGKRRHLARGLVEWFHRKGKAEHVGELRPGITTVGSGNCMCFVECGLDEECCSETLTSANLPGRFFTFRVLFLYLLLFRSTFYFSTFFGSLRTTYFLLNPPNATGHNCVR